VVGIRVEHFIYFGIRRGYRHADCLLLGRLPPANPTCIGVARFSGFYFLKPDSNGRDSVLVLNMLLTY